MKKSFEHYEMEEGPIGGFLEGKPFTDAFPALQSIKQENQQKELSKMLNAEISQKELLNTMWISAFKDVDKDLRQKKNFDILRNRLGLPGGGVLPGVSDQMRHVSKLREQDRVRIEKRKKRQAQMSKTGKGDHKVFDQLVERAEEYLRNWDKEHGVVPPRRRKRKKKNKKVMLKAQKSLNNAKRYYGRVGEKIKRGVMDMQKHNGRKVKARGLMEEVFHLQHRLSEAAIKIQRFRRYFVDRRLRVRLARSRDASIVIQKYVRGVLTRTRLARWWARRIYLICTLQAAFRGILERRSLRETRKLEYDSVLLIQSAWRGYLSRRRAAFEKMSQMATRVRV